MNSTAHAQLVLAALGSLGEIAALRAHTEAGRDRLRYQQAMAELQASTLAHIVDAVITRRIELVQDGFLQVLREHAVQAQHYMTQQDRYASAELDTSDPLRRIELRKRLNDTDVELRQIRLEARQLYDRMTEVLLLIGGASMHMDDTMARQLMLSSAMR